MAGAPSLLRIIGISHVPINKQEKIISELELFCIIQYELKNYFLKLYQSYFHLIKKTKPEAEKMIETNLTKLLLEDILVAGDYDIVGIARYIGDCEDTILDILYGRNTSPSIQLFNQIINIHKSIKPELYETIFRKVILKAQLYLETTQ